jgi:hypothetical protein
MPGAKAEDIIGYRPIDSSGDGLGSATFQPSLLEHGADATRLQTVTVAIKLFSTVNGLYASGSRLLASAIRSR